MSDGRVYHVGNTVFNIPLERIVDPNIPWTPLPKDGAFLFDLNPDAPFAERMGVHIGNLADDCKRVQGAQHNEMTRFCDPATADSSDEIYRGLKRIVDPEADVFWTYVKPKDGRRPEDYTVASCSGGGEAHIFCGSTGIYKDAIYHINFDEGQIPRLAELHREVQAVLKSWDVSERP